MSTTLTSQPKLLTIDKEELANTLTHGVGLVLSIVGLVNLVQLTGGGGTFRNVIGCTVYGTTLVLLYAASTIYHGMHNGRTKEILRLTDHIGIYLLIAGTYTPFLLTLLWDDCGKWLLGLVWMLAAAGIVSKLASAKRFHAQCWRSYLGMGWMGLVAVNPLLKLASVAGMMWLVAGGLFYTFGLPFFIGSKRFSHAVWHPFVIAGSICHYCAVVVCVLREL